MSVDEHEGHRRLGVDLNNATWDALDAGEIDAGSPSSILDALSGSQDRRVRRESR
jgi:hypothetical protein